MKKGKLSLAKMKRLLWNMGHFKIPMIAYAHPKLISIDNEKAIVKIRLRRRTKNHLNSMYFGALAVGADVTSGLHAYYFAEQEQAKISFVFKAVKAEFHKRATTHIWFYALEGEKVKKAFKEAIETKERINKWVLIEAKNEEKEIVATFKMQISIRVKS